MRPWPVSLKIVEAITAEIVGPVGVTLYRLENNNFKVCVTSSPYARVIYEMYIRRESHARRAYRAQLALHGRRLSKEFFA